MGERRQIVVDIEYSPSGQGYAEHVEQLKDALFSNVPNATFNAQTGRPESFEVKVQGVLVYSKLEKRRFPDCDKIGQYCKKLYETGEADQSIIGGKKKCCNIL